MKGIIGPLMDLKEYNSLLEDLSSDRFPIGITGLSGAQKAHFIFSTYKKIERPYLIVTFNELEAQRLVDDIGHFLPEKVAYFPAKEVVFYDIDAMSKDVASKRLNVIERLLDNEKLIVVTTFDALMQKMPQPAKFIQSAISLKVGDEIQMDSLINNFVSGGYEREEIVDGKGQFAVRGGIIDFFPFTEQFAYRMELFGDTVDSIRKFDTSTQRSVEMLQFIKIFPVDEAVYARSEIDDIIARIRTECEKVLKDNKVGIERKKKLEEKIEADIEELKEHGRLNNIDKYFEQFFPSWATLLEYCGQENLIIIDEPQRAKQRAETTLTEFTEMYRPLLEKGSILPSSFDIILDYTEVMRHVRQFNLIGLSSLKTSEQASYQHNYTFEGKEIGGFISFDQMFKQILEWKETSYRVVVLAGNRMTAQRINQEFNQKDLESIYFEDIDEVDIKPRQIIVTHGSLSNSFEYPSLKMVVISDKSLFGEEKKKKKASRNKRVEFTDLNLGDFVVHQAHGIGQYIGIDQLVVEGVKRDYLKIRYNNDDMLYIPTTQLEVIQKYIGSEGKAPKLNKLGGADWAKTKKRVRESLKDIAEELIRLYAQRQAEKGYSFSEDTLWQKQFEEQFPYQETDDQLRCIEEVKKDMESLRVMDRLLCGDVGFGKTEVAIRAAFKAAIDGKQIAYLVPTTILAQQHYNTFAQRMRDFPIKVEMLSRFRTMAQQKKILKGLKDGTIDVLIGTHRIISKDIQFKKLGLLIIDEEQRFGVAHKEKIKAMRSNVDVLTLTATPIPRTLHMAMVGIRDMSVLYDPPEDRHPVQTFVMEHDDEVIRDAIIREINRNGQVYYLSNRVKSIHRVAAELKNLVPQASITVAHGQMDEKQLEDIMLGFIEGKWNVLVCTSIIESGLDIPNVNTIIVEDADRMGLSQLYQLRGRVGRANRLAYAYITYKKDKTLSEEAEKRLRAIRDFTEFGSGFKIAMRDLEIRGAGNLLGPEQHGHMESVGYDMYCRLLDQAVRELKGEEVKEEVETQIELNISAYISEDYIQNENQKIEMYKKIASAQDQNDIEDIEEELIDRYGDIPAEVYNLLIIANIKLLARMLGINLISDKMGAVILQFDQNKLNLEILGKLINLYKGQILFSASNPPYLTYKANGKKPEVIKNIKNLLQSLKKLQSEE